VGRYNPVAMTEDSCVRCPVSPAFLARASHYLEATGVPLLERFHHHYGFTIVATGRTEGGYDLRDEDAEGESPPEWTWKEYAEQFGHDVQQVMSACSQNLRV
jgi:hypothetical protein